MVAIVVDKNGRQALISAGSGLFCGGTQRTALLIRQSTSLKPSSGRALYSPLAKPYSSSVAYSRSPAKSPVKGRPVRLAPCRPGARPTMSSRPPGSPNEGTGELNHSGSLARAASRKPASRGQSGQLRSGSVRARAAPGIGWPCARSFSIVEIVVIASRRHGGRALQELRRVMTRLARGRTLGWIAAELGLQLHQVGEDVGLAPQLVGDHRRPARNRAYPGGPAAAALD